MSADSTDPSAYPALAEAVAAVHEHEAHAHAQVAAAAAAAAAVAAEGDAAAEIQAETGTESRLASGVPATGSGHGPGAVDGPETDSTTETLPESGPQPPSPQDQQSHHHHPHPHHYSDHRSDQQPQQLPLPLPPPTTTTTTTHDQHQAPTAVHPDSPSQSQSQSDSHQLPASLQYDGLSVAATAVAHHGLQALEAATAAAVAPSPLAQQYAQSASMHVTEGTPYTPMTPHQSVHNGASMSPTPLQPQPHQPSHQLPPHMPPQQQQHQQHQQPPQAAQKVTRLRRACDMCSSRKVKCDESGPPCKPCKDLNVECTFSREMKRRGPPNKHAEAAKAAKRARMEGLSPVQSITDARAILGGQANVLDAEVIAPWPVLTLLVDDFFTYIHPLMPFPHEPTFRAAFNARADRTSTDFLALLASMIGVLVASFPRSARAHLKATHSTNLFPTAITMIDRCRAVAMDARGSTYMAKEDMTVDDATTSYFLALSAAYTLQWKTCKRFMAETMTFCRELLAHRRSDAVSSVADIAAALSGTNRAMDHIQDQISKRIFWVMVAGLRSMTQLGASINEIPLPPPTTQEPYPDLPVEVDDELIYPHQILAQPEGTTALITGFNHNVNTYMAMNELVGVDMCYGINFFEWSAQKSMLSNALSSTKAHLERLPDSLQINIDPAQLENGLGAVADDPNLRYYPPAFPATQPPNDVRHALAEDPHRRRRLQLEIQKANIYASQLATRSYFVERYLNLRDHHKAQEHLSNTSAAAGDAKTNGDVRDEMDNMVYEEREAIIKNLLTVLTSITQRNMEPNGVSLVNKIRQIASTLLNDAPERKGPVAKQAEEYLGKFLEILVKLERTGANTAPGTMTPQDEDDELQHWASLRDYQIQFVNSGGFLGSSY